MIHPECFNQCLANIFAEAPTQWCVKGTGAPRQLKPPFFSLFFQLNTHLQLKFENLHYYKVNQMYEFKPNSQLSTIVIQKFQPPLVYPWCLPLCRAPRKVRVPRFTRHGFNIKYTNERYYI